MKRFLVLTVLMFLVWACNQTPEPVQTGKCSVIDNNQQLQEMASEQSIETANQKEVNQKKEEIVPPAFSEDHILKEKEQDAVADKDEDVGKVLEEVEKILCDGDCTPYSMPPVNLLKLNEDINAALKNEGLNQIRVEINNGLEATLKGSVSSENAKNKAFEVTGRFKEISQVKDMIFIVETEEMSL